MWEKHSNLYNPWESVATNATNAIRGKPTQQANTKKTYTLSRQKMKRTPPIPVGK